MGCKKEGDFQSVSNYYDVTVKWYYNPEGQKLYRVELDGAKVTDSLSFEGTVSIVTKRVIGAYEGGKRLVVKETESGNVVLDTTIAITSGMQTIQLIKMLPDDKPTIYEGGGQGNEENPESRDAAKTRWFYSEASLPDSVKLVFYVASDAKPLKLERETSKIDSLVLYEGKLSRYVAFNDHRFGTLTRYLYDIFDANTGAVISEINIPTGFGAAFNKAKGFSPAITQNVGYNAEPPSKFITGQLFLDGARYTDKVILQTPW